MNRVMLAFGLLVCALAFTITTLSYASSNAGTSQPHLYFDNVDPSAGNPTNTPTRTPTANGTPGTCGNPYLYSTATATIVPGTTDTGNHCDDCTTAITLPFQFPFYGQVFSSARVESNGILLFGAPGTQFLKCLPEPGIPYSMLPYRDDLITTGNSAGCEVFPSGCGVFTSLDSSPPARIFNIEWRAVTFAGHDPVNFEIRLNEFGSFDFVYARVSNSGSSALVGIQGNAQFYEQYSCNTPRLSAGMSIRWSLVAACEPTVSPTNTPPTVPATRPYTSTSTRTSTPTSTTTACVPGNYSYSTSTATIVPGTTDMGNHCDDCVTQINLPFPYTLYETSYSTANVGSNGELLFVGGSSAFPWTCLPSSVKGPSIYPHYDDLRTDSGGPCIPGPCGVYTSISGSAPNRVFNIEWRARYFSGPGSASFEVRLYEGSPGRFDIVIGRLDQGGMSATVGVEDGSARFTQFECNTGAPDNTGIAFVLSSCGTPTVTPTPTLCTTNYTYATSTATVVPGTMDVGNHCDDCLTQITLPFPFALYGRTFTLAYLSSNGNMQFNSHLTGFTGACPPLGVNHSLMPFWTDLRTDNTGTCVGGCGIFTSTTGIAPNRVMNIEWRTTFFDGTGNAYFQVRLYENSPPQQFDFVYGRLDQGGGVSVVRDETLYVCYPGSPAQGLKIAWTLPPCGTVTPTGTPILTTTSTPTPPSTSTRSATPPGHTPTSTPRPRATICPMSFGDIGPGDYFYEAVRYLYCAGVVSGYQDGTFRPYNNTTRGQMSKIIVLARGWQAVCPGSPGFRDVPRAHPFYCYVETAYQHSIVSGYSCGQGCLEFRPQNNVTRGQLCKIVVLAIGWPVHCPDTGHFSDVPPTDPFYCFIETAHEHSIISGYADGTFRPGNSATRGQICVITYRAVVGP
jgi:hypothetical protein